MGKVHFHSWRISVPEGIASYEAFLCNITKHLLEVKKRFFSTMGSNQSNQSSTQEQSQDSSYFRVILNDKLKTIEPLQELQEKSSLCVMYATPEIQHIKRSQISNNSFIDAIFYAYNNHIDLQLCPEDFLFIINITIAHLIVSDEETYSHLVKQKQHFQYGSNANSVENVNWYEALHCFCEQMKQYTTTELVQVTEPNCSTTTSLQKMVHCGIMMAAYKNYFSYQIVLVCGIRAIRMEGSKEDWQLLKEQYSKIKLMFPELHWWYNYFDQVIDMMVEMRCLQGDGNAAQATPLMKKIWSKIISIDSYGSGSRTFNGWFQIFCPFDGSKQVLSKRTFQGEGLHNFVSLCEEESIYSGYSSCDVVIDTSTYTLHSGFIGIEICSQCAVKPVVGCIIERELNDDDFN